MNKYKLIGSSIKNQFHIYVIYLISLILSLTLYLTFINVSISTVQTTKQYMSHPNIYLLIIFILAFFLALLIIFLINYVRGLLINARSKELAVYRLVAFSRRELRKYLFAEQLLINLSAFVIASILAVILSIVLIDQFSASVQTLLAVEVNLQVQASAIIYELISIVIITLLITVMATRKIEKQELIDLLNNKQATPVETKEHYSVITAVIVICTWLGLAYILLNQFNHLKPLTLLVVLIIYLISIFSLYDVLAKVLVKIIPQKLYYQGANSFTISIIKRKLAINARSMAFVTVLILLSVFSLQFGFINTKFLPYLAMYDDFHISSNFTSVNFNYDNQALTMEFNDLNYNSFDDLEFSLLPEAYTISEYSYNQFASQNAFPLIDLAEQETLVLSNEASIAVATEIEGQQHDQEIPFIIKDYLPITSKEKLSIFVVADEYQTDMTEYFDQLFVDLKSEGTNPRKNQFKQGDLSLYRDDQLISENNNIMSESKANDYLKANEVAKEFNLADDETAYLGNIPYELSDGISLKNADVTFNLVDFDNSLDQLGFGLFVLNDQIYQQYNGYVLEYIEADYSGKYTAEYWQDVSKSNNFVGYVTTKNEQNTLLLMTTILVSGISIFLALIMLLLLITMIGVQVNIDSIETKSQFTHLKQLGYSRRKVHRIINKITIIYFIIPFIVGILNIMILYTVFKKYLIDYTTSSLIMETGIITNQQQWYVLLMMLCIYLLYSILVNYSYKRVIDQNE